jgi:uncharacterized protein (TIGR00255 family)
MTGYGRAEGSFNGKKIVAELRSLNSKQLDLSLRLPYLYKEKEMELRTMLSKALERGKADLSLSVDEQADNLVQVNERLIKQYIQQLKKISAEEGLKEADILALAMKMPDVLKSEKEAVSEEEWKVVLQIIEQCVESFNAFRSHEGEVLQKDFIHRIHYIKSLLDEVEVCDNQRLPNIKSRVRKNLAEVTGPNDIDENRFEQELIYYIEKIDITEEKVRLRSHCDYFMMTMNESNPGRKLGFITQEIGREINTIGSKANDAGIQQLVVKMKDELEKIKEQMLNVL